MDGDLVREIQEGPWLPGLKLAHIQILKIRHFVKYGSCQGNSGGPLALVANLQILYIGPLVKKMDFCNT